MTLLQCCALLFQDTITKNHENVLALLKHGLLFNTLYTFFICLIFELLVITSEHSVQLKHTLSIHL